MIDALVCVVPSAGKLDSVIDWTVGVLVVAVADAAVYGVFLRISDVSSAVAEGSVACAASVGADEPPPQAVKAAADASRTAATG